MNTPPIRRRSLLISALPALAAYAQDAPVAKHVVLLATLKLKPGREQDFVRSVTAIIERMKREDTGNIRYEYFVASPGRGAAEAPPTYVVYEEWRDQASAAGHQKWAGPIVRADWRDMTESMDILRLTPQP
jgi:quinol monooxygenase YgiN